MFWVFSFVSCEAPDSHWALMGVTFVQQDYLFHGRARNAFSRAWCCSKRRSFAISAWPSLAALTLSSIRLGRPALPAFCTFYNESKLLSLIKLPACLPPSSVCFVVIPLLMHFLSIGGICKQTNLPVVLKLLLNSFWFYFGCSTQPFSCMPFGLTSLNEPARHAALGRICALNTQVMTKRVCIM